MIPVTKISGACSKVKDMEEKNAVVAQIAVIGCGPAGAACAVQLARCDLRPVVFEPAEPGGTVRNAHVVENYPGFPGGVSGGRLADLIGQSLGRWQIELVREPVVSLRRKRREYELRTPSRTEFYGTVVVATGTRSRRLAGIAIDEAARSLIHYEAGRLASEDFACLGILGAGDVGVDYAIGFSKRGEVHVFHRSPNPSCIPLLTRRAEERGVRFHGGCSLVGVSAGGRGLLLEFTTGSHAVDFLIPAIGREPVLDFLDPELRGEPGHPGRRGLFFIGDVVNGRLRQVAIAAGDGLRTAMEVTRRCS